MTYATLLSTTGVQWGLVGPRESERLWERHLFNSVALSGLIGEGQHVADVGSGAGLPGIPLALARPDLQVTLVEPLLRRYRFLEQVVDELHLAPHVTLVRARAEELTQRFDVVACRAVAPLPRLVAWCVPLLVPGGYLLALKGASAATEVAKARAALQAARVSAEVLSVRAHPSAEVTQVVRVR